MSANTQTNEQFIYWAQIPVLSLFSPGAFVKKRDMEPDRDRQNNPNKTANRHKV